VELEKVPMKYEGLLPYEIWISESQERMTYAVPPEHVEAFLDLMRRRGVEATVIGDFTDSGRCAVVFKGKPILEMDMHFLHDWSTTEGAHQYFTPPHLLEPDFSGTFESR